MERLFNLDPQLIHDTFLFIINIFILFIILSYVLFDPIRKILEKRKENRELTDKVYEIKEKEISEWNSQSVTRKKAVENEATNILNQAKQEALKEKKRIIEEAKKQAEIIKSQANKDISLQEQFETNEMKKKIIDLAHIIAKKIIKKEINNDINDELFNSAIKELEGTKWED